jgi:uncharacterized protein YuzE
MTITIAGITFDRVDYDEKGDVLYLHVGDPATAVEFDQSPEGHALRFDARGSLVGITIVNARWLLEQGGSLTITIPERIVVDRAALGAALSAA